MEIIYVCVFVGEKLQFHVVRTFPGRGNVTVYWRILGHRVDQNFENSTGIILFTEVNG